MTSPLSRRSFLAAASAATAAAVAGAWTVGSASFGSPRMHQGAVPMVPAVRMTTTVPPPPAGKILFPMNPSPSCTVLDNFGECRPLGSCTRRHEGVDILASLGQEVYAVDDAVVVKREIQSSAGLMMNIQSADGTSYSYQHLSAFAAGLRIGDSVVRGQVIGYVGDTGNPGEGNYHLHFEWHPASAGGAARDPLPHLLVPDSCTVY